MFWTLSSNILLQLEECTISPILATVLLCLAPTGERKKDENGKPKPKKAKKDSSSSSSDSSSSEDAPLDMSPEAKHHRMVDAVKMAKLDGGLVK